MTASNNTTRVKNSAEKAKLKQAEIKIKLEKYFRNYNFVCNTFDHTPGIGTTPELATLTLHLNITPNNRKRDAVLQGEAKTTRQSVLTETRGHISPMRKKRMSQSTNLEYLVLFLKVFVLIRVTLGKLVDVDPELLDLLSDLEHMYTLKQ